MLSQHIALPTPLTSPGIPEALGVQRTPILNTGSQGTDNFPLCSVLLPTSSPFHSFSTYSLRLIPRVPAVDKQTQEAPLSLRHAFEA